MTIKFYEENAQDFFDSTKDVDVSPLYEEFLTELNPRVHILDAGCGSGRDSLAFIQRGFKVTSFDGSRQLALLASKLTGQHVETCSFTDFKSEALFDAIWASASLLHVQGQDLPEVFAHMADLLKVHGLFYCSFKLGNKEGMRNGRYFTNLDEQLLAKAVDKTALDIVKTWKSKDFRPDRTDEEWLNALLQKNG